MSFHQSGTVLTDDCSALHVLTPEEDFSMQPAVRIAEGYIIHSYVVMKRLLHWMLLVFMEESYDLLFVKSCTILKLQVL